MVAVLVATLLLRPPVPICVPIVTVIVLPAGIIVPVKLAVAVT